MLDDIDAAASSTCSTCRSTIRWCDICDPEFLGYHLLADSELSTQVVAKRDAADRVGNVVEIDGRLQVIEYSDLPDDVAEPRNADGSLAFWAGSIAVHVFDVGISCAALANDADALPFHMRARKCRMSTQRASGSSRSSRTRSSSSGSSSTCCPRRENAIVVEIDPKEGFAPLKNASGAATRHARDASGSR